MRVPACLHSGRGPTFTKQRDIGASIIAMSVAATRLGDRRFDGKRRSSAVGEADADGRRTCRKNSYYKGKSDMISHLMAPLMAH